MAYIDLVQQRFPGGHTVDFKRRGGSKDFLGLKFSITEFFGWENTEIIG